MAVILLCGKQKNSKILIYMIFFSTPFVCKPDLGQLMRFLYLSNCWINTHGKNLDNASVHLVRLNNWACTFKDSQNVISVSRADPISTLDDLREYQVKSIILLCKCNHLASKTHMLTGVLSSLTLSLLKKWITHKAPPIIYSRCQLQILLLFQK